MIILLAILSTFASETYFTELTKIPSWNPFKTTLKVKLFDGSCKSSHIAEGTFSYDRTGKAKISLLTPLRKNRDAEDSKMLVQKIIAYAQEKCLQSIALSTEHYFPLSFFTLPKAPHSMHQQTPGQETLGYKCLSDNKILITYGTWFTKGSVECDLNNTAEKHIDNLYVNEFFRKKKIGTRLMQAAFQTLAQTDLNKAKFEIPKEPLIVIKERTNGTMQPPETAWQIEKLYKKDHIACTTGNPAVVWLSAKACYECDLKAYKQPAENPIEWTLQLRKPQKFPSFIKTGATLAALTGLGYFVKRYWYTNALN